MTTDNDIISTSASLERIINRLIEPISSLLDHPTATNIFIPRYDTIFMDYDGKRELTDVKFPSAEALDHMIMGVARKIASGFNERNPTCFSTLPGGQRFTAIHPYIRPAGTMATIRLFPKVRISLEQLKEWGSLDDQSLGILKEIVLSGSNFMTVGSTNSGKTTLLNAMLKLIPSDTIDHILIAEDTPELSLPDWPLVTQMCIPDVIYSFARGGGEKLTLGKLVDTAMRLSGDRLIIGEVRYPDAAAALYDALNTGSTGVCGTIHANSATDSITRLANLTAGAREIPHTTIVEDLKSFLDYTIYVEKNPVTWERAVTEIVRFTPAYEVIYSR